MNVHEYSKVSGVITLTRSVSIIVRLQPTTFLRPISSVSETHIQNLTLCILVRPPDKSV